ncbi:hypothetical protein IE53DRAFT_122305 [Violaceomyces palustris]|uniref:Uncharacterized protein n=1 Tax=Violaceomyces palustris TaxID=1673888 RepID=A0ACD0NVX9_9BASI|nr:hypothetical protein IE53DRAFT_122305 [Violaceomyces palustris]
MPHNQSRVGQIHPSSEQPSGNGVDLNPGDPERPKRGRPPKPPNDIASEIVALKRKQAREESSRSQKGGGRDHRHGSKPSKVQDPPRGSSQMQVRSRADGRVQEIGQAVQPASLNLIEVEKLRRGSHDEHRAIQSDPVIGSHSRAIFNSKHGQDKATSGGKQGTSRRRAFDSGVRRDRLGKASKDEVELRPKPLETKDGRQIDQISASASVSDPKVQQPRCASDPRKLFDPRRHDPVRFAIQKRPAGALDASNEANANLASYLDGAARTPVKRPKDRSDREVVPGAEESHESKSMVHVPESTGNNLFPLQASADPTSQDTESVSKSDPGSLALKIRLTYRDICSLEAKLQKESHDFEAERTQLNHSERGKHLNSGSVRVNHTHWLKLRSLHQQLAETHSAFLELTLQPGLPSSVHALSRNHNIPTRLWQNGFHILLERLRHSLPYPQQGHPPPDSEAAVEQSALLDHLTEFIYFAYSFYTNLLECERFRIFRNAWMESLGDLARYKMAVAGLSAVANAGQGQVRNKAGRDIGPEVTDHSVRIDDEEAHADAASIGSAALGDWELIEKETWRETAKGWYAKGLAEFPGTGRLHHHIAVLSRSDELKALFHFCKSLTTWQPFFSARETILCIFDQTAQCRRVQSDASILDLFVHLHGMLFTGIQLDDFEDSLGRFIERLQGADSYDPQYSGEGLSQSSWMMMANINISSLLQYGSESSVFLDLILRQDAKNRADDKRQDKKVFKTEPSVPLAIILNQGSAGHYDGRDAGSTKTEFQENPADVSDEGSDNLGELSDNQEINDTVLPFKKVRSAGVGDDVGEELPLTLRYAMRLTFGMLDIAIRNHLQPATKSASINPFVTMILTYLHTSLKETEALNILARYIPWASLVKLSQTLSLSRPRDNRRGGLLGDTPLPEDWCFRGMTWSRRGTFQRGFWKSRSRASSDYHPSFETEMEALAWEDGFVEEDKPVRRCMEARRKSEANCAARDGDSILTELRWNRATSVLSELSNSVPGVRLDARNKCLEICEPLLSKLRAWEEKSRTAEVEARMRRLTVLDTLDPEGESSEELGDSDYDEDVILESDSPAVTQLKLRRRHLKSILRAATAAVSPLLPPDSQKLRQSRVVGSAKSRRQGGQIRQGGDDTKVKGHIVPGYTILILDTNVLLTTDDLLKQLVESERWTIVVPLAVITELDGLKRNATPLGRFASRSIGYLEEHVKSHKKWLKVQTSRGNYLSDISIRSEELSFTELSAVAGFETPDEESLKNLTARNIDEIILRALQWQNSHFVDRLPILSSQLESDRARVREDTHRAVLLTLDRNLRVKARARGLIGLGEKGIADILLLPLDSSQLAEAMPEPGG